LSFLRANIWTYLIHITGCKRSTVLLRQLLFFHDTLSPRPPPSWATRIRGWRCSIQWFWGNVTVDPTTCSW
jgi:hypothetical protein